MAHELEDGKRKRQERDIEQKREEVNYTNLGKEAKIMLTYNRYYGSLTSNTYCIVWYNLAIVYSLI